MGNNKFLVISTMMLLATLLSSCSLFGKTKEKMSAPVPPLPVQSTLLPDIKPLNPLLTTLTMSQEKVKFQTTDDVTIVGNWNSVTGARKAVLLLHMMPATKESYAPLADELNKFGFATLAIDFRGHGESTNQGDKKLNYNNFSEAEQQAKRLDVDAAMNFLKGKGFNDENILLVGASIGANLVADAMYRYNKVARGVLLSPGLDYRGVKTEPAIKQLTKIQAVWIVSSEGDKYSAESTFSLQQAKPGNVTISIVEESDHGTDLFESQTTLIQDIVKFLKS